MTVSPGWYTDPADRTTQRYWNGEDWQGAAVPADTHPRNAPPPPDLPEPVVESSASSAVSTANASDTGVTEGTGTGTGGDSARPVPSATGRQSRGKPARPTEPVRPHGMVLATPGARLLARLIDLAALTGLNAIINGWFIYQWLTEMIPYSQDINRAMVSGESWMDIPPPERISTLTLAIVITAAALWFAYEVPSHAQTGQTPGKRVLRLKVVRVEDTEPLGFMRSWRRWNPLGLPILLCGWCGPLSLILQAVDVMFIPMDTNQRMALHDRSAATYVVQLPPGKLDTQ